MYKMILRYVMLLLPLLAWAQEIGNVVAVRGEVYVQRGAERLTATNGLAIEPKDVIYTQKHAKTQLLFTDKTIFTLGQETQFAVDDYSADEHAPQAQFAVQKGTFRSITGFIGKLAPEKFKISTQNSTIGIRGTQIFGKIHAQEEIACTSGQISVTNALGEVIVNAGEITTVIPHAPPTIPRPYESSEIETIEVEIAPAQEMTQHDEMAQESEVLVAQEDVSDETVIEEVLHIKEDVPIIQEATIEVRESSVASSVISTQEVSQLASDQTNTLMTTQNNDETQSQTYEKIALDLGLDTTLYSTQELEALISFILEYDLLEAIITKEIDIQALAENPQSYIDFTNHLEVLIAEALPYVDWGVWLVPDAPTTGYTPQQIEGYFVAGDQTPTAIIDELIQNSVTANYSGITMGTLTTDGVAAHATGSVALAIDFGASTNAVTGTMTLGSWNMNIDSSTLYNDGFTLDALSGSDIAGSGSGGFFGPGADAVGGSFQALHTNGDSATGVFIGAKE